jgi:hypothetical protein
MKRLTRLLAGAVAFVAATLMAPGVASAKPVAATGGPTAVREYAGSIVFSHFDEASSRWYLTLRPAGATGVERLPVAPSVAPFAADIGPDSAGRPAVIYQRCITAAPLTGCDLFMLSLAAGAVERPVNGANHPAHNDVNPTLWRGRIAWTRNYGGVNPVIYTKRLTSAPSRPSRRLPGVPKRRCGEVEPKCGPTSQRSVEALELRGGKLAVIVRYQCAGCPGITQTELRLDSITRHTSRQIAFQASGLSGQSLIGPSFHQGLLSWYKACFYDPSGCRRGGAFRYTLSTRRYKRGRGAVALFGFVDAGPLLYEVVGCSQSQTLPDPGCALVEVKPSKYKATRSPRRVSR